MPRMQNTRRYKPGAGSSLLAIAALAAVVAIPGEAQVFADLKSALKSAGAAEQQARRALAAGTGTRARVTATNDADLQIQQQITTTQKAKNLAVKAIDQQTTCLQAQADAMTNAVARLNTK